MFLQAVSLLKGEVPPPKLSNTVLAAQVIIDYLDLVFGRIMLARRY